MDELNEYEQAFVDEYMRTFDACWAAAKVGFKPGAWKELIIDPRIEAVIQERQYHLAKNEKVDAAWVLAQLVDNHRVARLTGNHNASNKALEMICRHKDVDALAAAKSDVNLSDADAIAKLNAGRERVAQSDTE